MKIRIYVERRVCVCVCVNCFCCANCAISSYVKMTHLSAHISMKMYNKHPIDTYKHMQQQNQHTHTHDHTHCLVLNNMFAGVCALAALGYQWVLMLRNSHYFICWPIIMLCVHSMFDAKIDNLELSFFCCLILVLHLWKIDSDIYNLIIIIQSEMNDHQLAKIPHPNSPLNWKKNKKNVRRPYNQH